MCPNTFSFSWKKITNMYFYNNSSVIRENVEINSDKEAGRG